MTFVDETRFDLAVWYLAGPIGDIRAMGEHVVLFGHGHEHSPFRVVLTSAEAESIAGALLAAAHHTDEKRCIATKQKRRTTMKDSRKITITWDDEEFYIKDHDDLEHDEVEQMTSLIHVGQVLIAFGLAQLPQRAAAKIWMRRQREIEDFVFLGEDAK